MLLGAVTTLRPNITPKWVLIPQINMYLTLIWALIPRIVLDTHSILSSCIVHIKTMYSLYGLYIYVFYIVVIGVITARTYSNPYK